MIFSSTGSVQIVPCLIKRRQGHYLQNRCKHKSSRQEQAKTNACPACRLLSCAPAQAKIHAKAFKFLQACIQAAV
jgi:hypothetical protein